MLVPPVRPVTRVKNPEPPPNVRTAELIARHVDHRDSTTAHLDVDDDGVEPAVKVLQPLAQ